MLKDLNAILDDPKAANDFNIFLNTYFWLRSLSCLYSKPKILIDVLDIVKNLNAILVDPNADVCHVSYISVSMSHYRLVNIAVLQ